ncbi:MAG TPA: hypothetical protein VIM71_02790, partial [Lacunisphaera sp.]
IQELNEGALKISAAQINDAAAGDVFVETHRSGNLKRQRPNAKQDGKLKTLCTLSSPSCLEFGALASGNLPRFGGYFSHSSAPFFTS